MFCQIGSSAQTASASRPVIQLAPTLPATASTSTIVSVAHTTRPTTLSVVYSSAARVRTRTSPVSTPTRAVLFRPTLSHLRAWVRFPRCHTNPVSPHPLTVFHSSPLHSSLVSQLHPVLLRPLLQLPLVPEGPLEALALVQPAAALVHQAAHNLLSLPTPHARSWLVARHPTTVASPVL